MTIVRGVPDLVTLPTLLYKYNITAAPTSTDRTPSFKTALMSTNVVRRLLCYFLLLLTFSIHFSEIFENGKKKHISFARVLG